MKTENIVQHILSNTYTKTDCYRRLALLQDFLGDVLFTEPAPQGDLRDLLLQRYTSGEERSMAEAVAAWGGDVIQEFSPEHLGEEIEEIKKQIEALPELVLYVPVPMGAGQVQMIGEWCRAQVKADIVLELHVDPNTAGGCAFVWKSVFHDFSLQYFMDKHHTEILKIFDAYSTDPQKIPASQTA